MHARTHAHTHLLTYTRAHTRHLITHFALPITLHCTPAGPLSHLQGPAAQQRRLHKRLHSGLQLKVPALALHHFQRTLIRSHSRTPARSHWICICIALLQVRSLTFKGPLRNNGDSIDAFIPDLQLKPRALALHFGTLRNPTINIPSAVSFANVTKIDLQHNALFLVPWSLQYITQLRELVLDHNRIQDVPLRLCSLPRLERLSLSNNNIARCIGLFCV